MTKLNAIEGIGYASVEKLQALGIETVEQLLQNGRTEAGRKRMAAASKVTAKRMLGWVCRADLSRVKGIGSEYADLLEAAGVHTVADLAQQSADALCDTLKKCNQIKKRVRRVPATTRVAKWIEQARRLPTVVEV